MTTGGETLKFASPYEKKRHVTTCILLFVLACCGIVFFSLSWATGLAASYPAYEPFELTLSDLMAMYPISATWFVAFVGVYTGFEVLWYYEVGFDWRLGPVKKPSETFRAYATRDDKYIAFMVMSGIFAAYAIFCLFGLWGFKTTTDSSRHYGFTACAFVFLGLMSLCLLVARAICFMPRMSCCFERDKASIPKEVLEDEEYTKTMWLKKMTRLLILFFMWNISLILMEASSLIVFVATKGDPLWEFLLTLFFVVEQATCQMLDLVFHFKCDFTRHMKREREEFATFADNLTPEMIGQNEKRDFPTELDNKDLASPLKGFGILTTT